MPPVPLVLAQAGQRIKGTLRAGIAQQHIRHPAASGRGRRGTQSLGDGPRFTARRTPHAAPHAARRTSHAAPESFSGSEDSCQGRAHAIDEVKEC
jgi:hypothetical protein